MEKPHFELSLGIAGFIINVKSEIDLNRFKDLSRLTVFKSAEKGAPDCRLFLKSRRPPLPSKRKYFFNPGDNWKIFKTAHGFLVEVGVPDKMGHVNEVIEFNADYSRAYVYRKNIFELSRYFLDQFLLANLLSLRQGFILHACGLVWKNQGLVFCGRSGAGKSTLLKLFSSEIGADALLNDDRIAVRKYDIGWKIFGTPWHGQFPAFSPASAPLKALYFIKHAPKNHIRLLPVADTYRALFQHVLLPYWDEEQVKKVMDTFKLLTSDVQAYELGVVPDKGIINFITKNI